VIVETTQSLTWFTTMQADSLQRAAEVIEQALVAKVLERSTVYRQATVWTPSGEAEHFLLLRADTTSVREIAAAEAARYLDVLERGGGVGGGLGRGYVHPSAASTREPAGAAGGSRAPSLPVRRFTFSWLFELPDSLEDLNAQWWAHPRELAAGFNLAPSGAAGLVLGALYRWQPATAYTLEPGQHRVHLSAVQDLSAVVFLGAVYTGYRETRATGIATTQQVAGSRPERALVVGLGFPMVTERAHARFTNLYLHGTVWPRLEAMAAGLRWAAFGEGGLGLFLTGEAAEELTPLGKARSLLSDSRFPDEVLWHRRVTGVGGIEIGAGQAARLVVRWRLTANQLGVLPPTTPYASTYAIVFRRLGATSPVQKTLGLEAGFRLAL